jgi:hypothetical protein
MTVRALQMRSDALNVSTKIMLATLVFGATDAEWTKSQESTDVTEEFLTGCGGSLVRAARSDVLKLVQLVQQPLHVIQLN